VSGSVEAWVDALLKRHVEPFGKPAFLKAVRALSVRYVEQRDRLRGRSPIDSAGKRAAFAGFFAPAHFMTTSVIVQLMKLNESRLDTIVDLGCGTGVAGAAWALAQPGRPRLVGVETHPWAIDEAKWNWRMLGLEGRVRRGDLVDACVRLRPAARRPSPSGTAIVLAWAVNELDDAARGRLLPALLDLARDGASMLVIEPLARRAAPWWDEWAATFGEARGVAEEWPAAIKFQPPFDELDRAAGFRRESLGARSLSIRGNGP
jgi:hypothetical protein